MKDARGHGSDSRGGSVPFKTAGLRGVGLALNAKFEPRYSNSKDVVDSLRSQMRGTGAGHQAGLLQGIKNFLGGRS